MARGHRFIVEQKSVAVATEDEWYVERFRISKRLLNPGTNRVVVVLGLHDSDWEIRLAIRG